MLHFYSISIQEISIGMYWDNIVYFVGEKTLLEKENVKKAEFRVNLIKIHGSKQFQGIYVSSSLYAGSVHKICR